MSQHDGLSLYHPPSRAPTTPQTSSAQTPPSNSHATSITSRQMSKIILRTALEKANSAVLCDSSNDVEGAIDAYSEAIALLDRVLETVEKESDRRRLQEIHDSYSERIRLLSALSPRSDVDDIYETFDDHDEPELSHHITDEYSMQTLEMENDEEVGDDNDARSWLSRPARRNYSTRRESQPAYASLVRRMTSSSSIASSTSSGASGSPNQYGTSMERIERTSSWSSSQSAKAARSPSAPNDNSNQPSDSQNQRPPSPVPSESTPTQSRPKMTVHRPSNAPNEEEAHPLSGHGFEEFTPPGSGDVHAMLPRHSSKPAAVLASKDAGVDDESKKQTDGIRRSSSASSVSSAGTSLDSLGEEDLEASVGSGTSTSTYQPAMTLPPLMATEMEAANAEAVNNDGFSSPSTSPRSTSLPQIQKKQSKDKGVRSRALSTSSSMSEQPKRRGSISMIAESMQRVSSQPQTPSSKKSSSNRQSGGGFASVRKKSSNRLSRRSMDGAPSLKRTHSSHGGTPLFGLFMKDVISSSKSSHGHEGMDYITQKSEIGMAYTTDIPYMTPNHSSTTGGRIASTYGNHRAVVIDTSESSQPLRLVLALEKSMDQGAYITPRLFIPKNLWNQPNIRLPHIEVKVAACESLMGDLSRLEKWQQLDDLTSSLKLLETLEDAVESLNTTLSKKLKRESMDASKQGQVISPTHVKDMPGMMVHEGSISSRKTQSFMSWGTKLSKSVERMNAFSLTKAEDQYRNYIEVLQRMFGRIHVLINWWQYYLVMKEDKNRTSPVCDIVLSKLTRICDRIDVVVGGFVVRDMTIMLGKWLKRGGSWVNE